MTITHLRDVVERVAPFASEYLEIGPHFPVDLPPGDPVGFPDKGDKLLEVPRSINYMFSPNLSVIIDIGFTLGAMKHFSLTHGEQLVAEGTLVQVVALLLE